MENRTIPKYPVITEKTGIKTAKTFGNNDV